jgi:Gp157 protein
MNINPLVVRQQIENLKVSHPELIEDDEAWLASLESETRFEELVTQLVRRIDDSKALAEGTAGRLTELQERKARLLHRMESLRNLLFKLMESAELAKLELPEATITIRKGQPQLVGDADPADLCDVYCKISRTLDRTAIKSALKDGVAIPGFSLSNATPSLSIRTK